MPSLVSAPDRPVRLASLFNSSRTAVDATKARSTNLINTIANQVNFMEEKEVRELEQCYQKLESKKTLLMRLDETVPWEEFRPTLEQIHDRQVKK